MDFTLNPKHIISITKCEGCEKIGNGANRKFNVDCTIIETESITYVVEGLIEYSESFISPFRINREKIICQIKTGKTEHFKPVTTAKMIINPLFIISITHCSNGVNLWDNSTSKILNVTKDPCSIIETTSWTYVTEQIDLEFSEFKKPINLEYPKVYNYSNSVDQISYI